jgi:outer membrane receptor for ferrienterochelin and colicins
MKEKYLLLSAIFTINTALSQNKFQAQIKDALTNDVLPGSTAFIQVANIAVIADSNGVVEINNIPDGIQVIKFQYVGYEQEQDTIIFPQADSSMNIIFLRSTGGDLEEVIISATRSSRTIDDIPTRVEVISADELDEKATMQPANAKMILTESTGIQTQQTSATSANASIRIQGLDGKYTQLLKDGFPLYSEFSSGLSIIQIPPLDLKRVEVIKGASSTLYGGGAIAGLINFVTKVPSVKRELSFLVNGNMTKATDLSGYYSQKFRKTGFTLFVSQNIQPAYDTDKDGLSDIPKFRRYSINPKLFFYIDQLSTLSFGINSNFENRTGGDMKVINSDADSVHTYFEKNHSDRISSVLMFERRYPDKGILTVKNSIGYFNRTITKSDYLFSGRQLSSFSELNYEIDRKKTEWIIGGNLWTDDFTQTNSTPNPLDNNLLIGGVFVQNNFRVTNKLIFETGFRADENNQSGLFLLPRISAMYKINPKLTTRIGGGLGYKTPTIFSEEAEEKSFKNIQPLDLNKVGAEDAIGWNFDFNYKTTLLGKFSFSINQLFFYTRVKQPLILNDSILPNGNYEFVNANGFLDSKGLETNVKIRYDVISFYCGYTLIDAATHFNNNTRVNPLTAKNRIYLTLMYEIENKLRVGYELFYTGQQQLSNSETRPDYWIMGISAEYIFKHFSLFVNAENFTDRRQSRYEQMYSGGIQNPQFKEIWAPTDGFIFNGGFKVNVW